MLWVCSCLRLRESEREKERESVCEQDYVYRVLLIQVYCVYVRTDVCMYVCSARRRARAGPYCSSKEQTVSLAVGLVEWCVLRALSCVYVYAGDGCVRDETEEGRGTGDGGHCWCVLLVCVCCSVLLRGRGKAGAWAECLR